MNVLIITSDSSKRSFFEKTFSDSPYSCRFFERGDDAFHFLMHPDPEPDAVLMDYYLRGMSGVEILQKLFLENRKYSYALLSEGLNTDQVVEAVKLGVREFIQIPESDREDIIGKTGRVCLEQEKYRIDKAKERELVEKNNKYQTLLDAAFDALIITEKGIILDVNNRAVEKSGYSYDELIGMDVMDLVVTRKEKLLADMHDRRWINSDAVVRTKSGTQLNVMINSREAEYQGRSVRISSVHDITDSRIMEEKLRQVEKMNAIAQLAGGIAHDFNNQLSPVIGYADMLYHHLDDPQYRRFAENILHSALRSADLVKKLLSFARKGQIVFEAVNVNEILSQVLDTIIPENSNISVNRLFGPMCGYVTGDPGQIRQALENILTNSMEAMPEEGELTVNTRCVTIDGDNQLCLLNHLDPGSYLKISIVDTGWGIPDELKKHIFEPFFSTREAGKATGLGLASAYGTVIEHEGYITFNSEVGRGTEFILYFPIDGNYRGKEISKMDLVPGKARKSSILIVDDEEMLRSMLADILESDDHRIWSCGSGEEALQIFRRNKGNIDLVILDMVMPGMDGWETFSRLKEIDSGVQVIISSGYNMKKDFRKLKEAGVLAFMKKPYKVNELRKQLKKILG